MTTRNAAAFVATLLASLGAASAGPGDLLFKLYPRDTGGAPHMGGAVAVGAGVIIAGAPNDDEMAREAGAAYVYDAATGELIRKLTVRNGQDDRFGSAAAISGSTAIISAPGAAIVYAFDADALELTGVLQPEQTFLGRYFGYDIDISGDIAVVGALDDNDNGKRAGAAYVFRVSTGERLFKLKAPDGAPQDDFGAAVAISGTLATVAAHRHDAAGGDSGAAYVYDILTGELLHKLIPDDAAAGDFFGYAADADGDLVILTAVRHDANGSDAGAAYLFDMRTGEQIRKLLPADGAAGDFFGRDAAICADTAIVGLYRVAPPHTGAAYLFDVPTGRQIASIPGDGTEDDYFGNDVDVGGERGSEIALVGILGDDTAGEGAGAAAAYDASRCPADFNGDLVLDTRDIIAFLGAWSAGDQRADWNRDGDIDSRDLLAYLDDWSAGC
jgi:outer membrane protein assembly factor BamB